MGLANRRNLSVTILLVLFGLTCVLVLPGLPVGRAATTRRAASQKANSSELDSSRQAAMEKLYDRFKGGDPFSEEEGNILRKFAAGGAITDLEADLVISRALFDYYIAAKELTKEQEGLLDQYMLVVAKRSTGVADLKTQMLNNRIAAAAAAPPRTTPLAPPSNDTCGGAVVIPAGGPFPHLTAVTADITDATVTGDPPLPSCQNNVSRSIWYTFNPSTTTQYTISTCTSDGTATTVRDTVMAIYTSSGSCGGPFTEVPSVGISTGCGDDECVAEDFQAVIATQLNSGTQYYIVVWQFGGAAPLAGQTAVQLHIGQTIAPVNDNCAGALTLTLDQPLGGTNVAAGNDYQLSGAGCFTGVGQNPTTAAGRDAVYSFTAPSAGNYSFKATNYNSLGNLVLYVATSCPAGSPPVTVGTCLAAANRTNFRSSEEVSCVALSSGQQVFVFVDDGLASSEGSSFTIEVNLCTREAESNNTPATANALACGIEGSITPIGDADFYSLGTPASGSRVFALVDGVAGNGTDFDLRVTTTTDTLEYDDSNNDAQFGSFSPNVAGTPLSGLPSFIRVSYLDPDVIEPYRLYAVVQPPSASAASETEPNNTFLTANSATGNYFSGSLVGPAPSTDVDFFSFTANAGDLIFLSLDGDPLRNGTPINAALELIAGDGTTTLIAVNDSGPTSSTAVGVGLTAITPFSPAEGLVFRATTTGTFYARVSIGTIFSSVGAGDYLLSISRNCFAGTTPTIGTIGLYDPTPSAFFLKNSNSAGPADLVFPYGPGASGWTPIAGDWNGDGVDTVGLYNPTTSTFFLKNTNSAGPADLVFPYGPAGAGWTPIVGDWNGDGVDTIGLYNPATSTFFLRDTNSAGPGNLVFPYGPAGAGWTPIVGDWDGNGTDTIGLFNPSTSTFFLKNTNSAGAGDLVFGYGPGGAGWTPVVGDWNGDGVDTVGLYDPASGFFFLKNTNAAGPGDLVFGYGPGGAGWKPIVGDWGSL
jgi:hypothetical protein